MTSQDPQVQTTEETSVSPMALVSSSPKGALRGRSFRLNEIFDLLNKFVTTAAVIVGGVWTYKLFVENREAYARANLQHEITVIDIDDERRLLRLDVTIENTGNIILPLRSAEVRIEAVLPLSERIERTLDGTMSQIVTQGDFFSWPAIRVRHSEWDGGKFELEPEWGVKCGADAAESFCTAMGYRYASDWAQDPNIGARSPTLVIKDQAICDQEFCDGFEFIACSR